MATASTPQSPAPRCPTDGPRITAATAATIKWKISANENNINNANKNSNSPNRWAEQFWQILIDGVNVTNLSKCEKRLFWHRNQQKIAKTVIFLKQKYKTVKMIFASIWPIGYCSFNSGGGGISRILNKKVLYHWPRYESTLTNNRYTLVGLGLLAYLNEKEMNNHGIGSTVVKIFL